MEKFRFSEEKLNAGYSLTEIAGMLGMKLGSLYVLRSDIKKVMGEKSAQVDIKKVVNHISLMNLKEHLRTNSKIEKADYLFKQFTINKKPLQSNGIAIIEAIREMLLLEFQSAQ